MRRIDGSQQDTNRHGDLLLQDSILRTAYEAKVPRFFSMTLSADVAAVTGDGTVYTPVWDTEVENEFDLFDVDNNKFVAQEAGFYMLMLQITVDNVTASAKTAGVIGFGIPGGSTITGRFAHMPLSDDEATQTLIVPLRMTALQEWQPKLYYDGGSLDVVIRADQPFIGGVGSNVVIVSHFSGYKLSE